MSILGLMFVSDPRKHHYVKDIRDKIMDDKFIYTPNVRKQNYLFCRLKLLVEKFKHFQLKLANQNSINVPNVLYSTNKKTLGTSLSYRSMSPPSPIFFYQIQINLNKYCLKKAFFVRRNIKKIYFWFSYL